MTPEEVEHELIECKHRQPFVPFVVELVDGQALLVGSPALSICGGGAGFLAPDGGLVDFEFQKVRALKPLSLATT